MHAVCRPIRNVYSSIMFLFVCKIIRMRESDVFGEVDG